MLDYVSGNIASVGENRIVVDCGGVGFCLTASVYACEKYAKLKQALVPVYLAVREDALELYGFLDENERKIFTQLISVSGVGAKLAVSVLSGLPTDRLLSAIASGDTVALSNVKGVGKKTAERIVLELKTKVESLGASPAVFADGPAPDSDAVSALVALGYEKREAEAAVRRASLENSTTEEIVRAVLRGNR